MAGDPVLIVVARAPTPGRTKTRLCPPLDGEGAARLYTAFLLDLMDTCAALVAGGGVDVEIVGEGDLDHLRALCPFAVSAQADGDLGDRLRAALAAALDDGRPAAAVVGSDNPDLPLGHLRALATSLAAGRSALGAVDDGGYWALGLTAADAPAGLPALFSGIAWSTAAVADQTRAAAAGAGVALDEAPAWADCDTAADVQRLLARSPGAGPAPRTRQLLAHLWPARTAA